jgi:hypothetical protein
MKFYDSKEFSEMLLYREELNIYEMRNERREWETMKRETVLSRFKLS